jgi:hypothetical protein
MKNSHLIVYTFLSTTIISYSSASCLGSGSVIFSSSGSITGPNTYVQNEVCTWTLAPNNANRLVVSLDFSSSIAYGDTILIYSCSYVSCIGPVLMATCTQTTRICSSTLTKTNPIMMVKFQGSSSGVRSFFSLSYSSTQSYATETCPETNCPAHCSFYTASACTSASSCQLRSSDPTAPGKSCSCTWTYRGTKSTLESAPPDYQTNGACGDWNQAMPDMVASAVAISMGILVRPAHANVRARCPT